MCVIICVPKGVELPPIEVLQAAFKRNPDGCGFVSATRHYKSLHFRAFYRHLIKRDINENVIIHFRYATHGSVRLGNCHPFYRGRCWFMHNGVLPIASENDKTDSQICFNRYIYPKIKKYGYGSTEHLEEMKYWTSRGSKFAMMHNGEMIMSGNFILKNGCYFSNLNFTTFI